jgi:SAM-dependent methyltransferase
MAQLEGEVFKSVAEPHAHAPPPKWIRLFTEWGYALRALRHVLRLPNPLVTEDRRILEQVIFGYYRGRADIRSLLFVGCQWYTKHYQSAYFAQHDYWTIDPAERARKHGGRQHVVAPLERLDQFFPKGYFDLIICNGVYGFGLDTREQCESAFAHCHSRLRDGGHLVLGWDDVPARTPVPLAKLTSLARFRRFEFPEVRSWRYVTQTPYRHTYDFYCR